ncbi:hypothetical protein AB6M97_01725 [Streptococcus hillyeri]|uniref:hypothetical protein n=1 Tax=Streptococcus hillyeri TaxID=2282420 RepID=UPI0034E27C77
MIYIDTSSYHQVNNQDKSVEMIYFDAIQKLYNSATKFRLGNKSKLLKQFFNDCCDKELLGELGLIHEKTILKNLILMSPEKIEKLVAEIDVSKFRDDFNKLRKKKPNKEDIELVPEKVKAAYLLKEQYQKSSGIMSQKVDSIRGGGQMNMFLVEILAITVCPYCNRNFINNRGDKFSAQMDHFYSKDDYPFLAVSLYNLIPTCGACNHIKSTQNFHIHPFLKPKQEDSFTFGYQYTSLGDMEIKIATSDRRKNDFEAIRLEEAYQIHHIDVRNMLKREERYSKGYRKELQELFKSEVGGSSSIFNESFNLELTNDEIDRMIYGDAIFEEDIKNIPLGKFRKDIYKEIKSLRGY